MERYATVKHSHLVPLTRAPEAVPASDPVCGGNCSRSPLTTLCKVFLRSSFQCYHVDSVIARCHSSVMIETAGGSAFVFITTDPRNKPTREAIKVHVLRQRRQSRTHDYSGLLAPSVTGHPGGEFHIWDFAAEGRTPRSSETATLPLDNDEAAPSSALVQIDQVVLGGPSSGSMASPDDPLLSLETRGREVVTVSSLFSGGSDELLAHYCTSDFEIETR